MATAEQQTADEEQEYEERPWVNITPTTRISGVVEELFIPQLGESSYGVVISDPEVVVGNLYRNNQKPDGEVTRSVTDEGSSSPTDYRVADPDYTGNNVVGPTLVTDEESIVDGEQANQYDETDVFEEDSVVLWLSGMKGDKIVRALDFNGRPYARYTDGGPTYGFFQAHSDWWADDADRGQLASEGKAPKPIRPPILRPDLADTTVLVDVTAGEQNANGYIPHFGNVFRRTEFESEFGSVDFPTDEMPENQYGIDAESRVGLRQADEPEATIEEQSWNYHRMFDASWGSQPPKYAAETTLDTSPDTIDVSMTDEQEFAEEVIGQLSGLEGQISTLDEPYDGGFESLVERNSDALVEGFDVQESRSIVLDEFEWLDG